MNLDDAQASASYIFYIGNYVYSKMSGPFLVCYLQPISNSPIINLRKLQEYY